MHKKLWREVKRFGGRAAFARDLVARSGMPIQSVNVDKWVYGTARIPAQWCPFVEDALGGTITVEQMRPDLAAFWKRMGR